MDACSQPASAVTLKIPQASLGLVRVAFLTGTLRPAEKRLFFVFSLLESKLFKNEGPGRDVLIARRTDTSIQNTQSKNSKGPQPGHTAKALAARQPSHQN